MSEYFINKTVAKVPFTYLYHIREIDEFLKMSPGLRYLAEHQSLRIEMDPRFTIFKCTNPWTYDEYCDMFLDQDRVCNLEVFKTHIEKKFKRKKPNPLLVGSESSQTMLNLIRRYRDGRFKEGDHNEQ